LAFSNCLDFLRAWWQAKKSPPNIISSSFILFWFHRSLSHHLHSLAFFLHEWRVWEGLLSSCQPQSKSCAWPSTSNSILRHLLASTNWEQCALSEQCEFHSIVETNDLLEIPFKFCLCRCKTCCEITITTCCNN
jgi:hypothetical protein